MRTTKEIKKELSTVFPNYQFRVKKIVLSKVSLERVYLVGIKSENYMVANNEIKKYLSKYNIDFMFYSI